MNVLIVIGTRPEAIKMASVIAQIEKTDGVNATICLTAQQREMVDQTLSAFSITPDIDLDVMGDNQSLCSVSAKILAGLQDVIIKNRPDAILVQGDTSTALCGALAGFYNKIPVGHVEAGLRTGNKYSPYPEEINRSLIGRLANHHYAPTKQAARNLLEEGNKPESVVITGNTVIDSLLLTRNTIRSEQYVPNDLNENLDANKRIVLVTGHRRENMGSPVEEICRAIAYVASNRSDVQFIYPVHLNPNIQGPVSNILSNVKNVSLVNPLDYKDFVWLLNKCDLVLTDSGGIQEEAPSFGKPVLVMRDTTERPEGIESGNTILVGHQFDRIVNSVNQLLNDEIIYRSMAEKANPYGSGDASEKIVEHLLQNIFSEIALVTAAA